MKPVPRHIPIYRQFIELLKSGINLLDENTQLEIRQFISGQQNAGCGFVDRGGKPDLYYSLFGFWLASAFNMRKELDRLKHFIQDKKETKNQVEQYVMQLIHLGLSSEKPSGNLLKMFLKRAPQVNFPYQLFLFLLVFDARYGKKQGLYLLMRLILFFFKPHGNLPCSMVAALTVAKHEVGLDTQSMSQKLLAFFDEKSAFKTFEQLQTGDMLSTAVALFALQKTGFDLRLVAPKCLEFIQQHYADGAFLSGDGDQTCDLEYTFYGLLALGSLGRYA